MSHSAVETLKKIIVCPLRALTVVNQSIVICGVFLLDVHSQYKGVVMLDAL